MGEEQEQWHLTPNNGIERVHDHGPSLRLSAKYCTAQPGHSLDDSCSNPGGAGGMGSGPRPRAPASPSPAPEHGDDRGLGLGGGESSALDSGMGTDGAEGIGPVMMDSPVCTGEHGGDEVGRCRRCWRSRTQSDLT